MAIFTGALGALLLLLGVASLAVSVNLVPTEMGLLYAISGVVFVSAGAIVLAVAALTWQIERLSRPRKRPEPAPEPAPPHEVGRHSVAGVECTIYSDGSLEAAFPDQPRRFGSMADFRAFVEAGVALKKV